MLVVLTIAEMRAELKTLYSLDVPDLEAWQPEDPECFALNVRAIIGPEGSEGEESFDVTICTAAWLAQEPPPKGFEFLHSRILVERWQYETVKRALGDLCVHTSGKNWIDIANRLSRYMHWEFDDYRD